MKLAALFLILSSISAPMHKVVEDFHMLESQESEERFISEYAGVSSPSIAGYVIALEMKQAEYTINPVSKMKIFMECKHELNSLIKENSSNVHLRYLRLMLQEKSPFFLGYNDHVKEDKNFLQEILKKVDDSDFLDGYIVKNTSL